MFIKKTEKTEKSDKYYITLEDIEVLSGTFTKGTILEKLQSDPLRGVDFMDCEGNFLLETKLVGNKIVPIEEAYKLFGPRAK